MAGVSRCSHQGEDTEDWIVKEGLIRFLMQKQECGDLPPGAIPDPQPDDFWGDTPESR